MNWWKLARIALMTVLFFVACNLIFAAVDGIDFVNRLSIYNVLVPGRERLPYGETPAAYNLSLDSIPAMFASHIISRPKAADEYRVVLIGDSSVWGWRLTPDQVLAAALNARDLRAADGRRMVFYNLAYPIQSLLKDALLIEEAAKHQPDMFIWFVTLDGFPREKQLFPPLVQRNSFAARSLIARHAAVALDADDPRFYRPTSWDATIIGGRRPLADWLRLQIYGFAWALTGVDQAISETYVSVQADLDAELSWNGITEPRLLTDDDLAFDVLEEGMRSTSGNHLLIVDEPMYISSGANSDMRYNQWYPRWAFDAFRDSFTTRCDWWDIRDVRCLDLWDAVPPEEFTDSPVHLSPEGVGILADRLTAYLSEES